MCLLASRSNLETSSPRNGSRQCHRGVGNPHGEESELLYYVDQSVIDKEIEIAKDQLRQEGKPEAMLDNIAKGKLKRFFKDNTLINQAFIKDSKQSVADYVKSVDSSLKITGFQRVALG